MTDMEKIVLKSLARQYPSIAAASTEIINLQSILNLPKGTEHFLSDIHGEYYAFDHILRSGSGVIKDKINQGYKKEINNALTKKAKLTGELSPAGSYIKELISKANDIKAFSVECQDNNILASRFFIKT